MWWKGCYRTRISGIYHTFTQGSHKTTPASETTLTMPSRGVTLVETHSFASGCIPFQGSIAETSPFPSAWCFQLLVEHIEQPIRDQGRFFPINKPLIQTQPVQQDPPLFAYCILHIYYKFYTIWELLLSDDELKAPGTKLLFLFQSLGYQLRAGEVWSDKTVRRESFPFLFALGQMPFFWSQMGIRESNLGDFTPFSKGRGGFLSESSWSFWGRASILAEICFALII